MLYHVEKLKTSQQIKVPSRANDMFACQATGNDKLNHSNRHPTIMCLLLHGNESTDCLFCLGLDSGYLRLLTVAVRDI